MIAAAVAKILDDSIESLTFRPNGAGGNVFVDWMPDQPDVAVAVMTGQTTPNLSKLPCDVTAVQVLVRHTSIRAVADLSAEINNTLACLPAQIVDEDGSDEIQIVGVTPGAYAPIGRDVKERPEWSLNFSIRHHDPTSHRPAVTA